MPFNVQRTSSSLGIVGTVGVPSRYGGFETLAEQLARYMPAAVHDLVIYCQRSAYPEVLAGADKRFEGHRRVFVPLKANGAASMVHDVLAMLHAALIARVEVMLVLGYSGAWALPLMRLLRPKMRIVTNIDGMEWRRDKFSKRAKRVLRWLEDRAVGNSDCIIADNAALVTMAQSIHPGLNPMLIAYGGDHTLVAPGTSPIDCAAPYYLSVARIEPENNCQMILEAFGMAGSAPLVFVGNWSANEYGRTLKARFGRHANLHLLDPIYDLSVLAALRAGACGYVHGHSVGGTNPSLVEAIFHARRVLAFDCAFNRSSLNGHGGYFVDAESLVRQLEDEHAGTIDDEALEALRMRYRWSTVVQSYLDACMRR